MDLVESTRLGSAASFSGNSVSTACGKHTCTMRPVCGMYSKQMGTCTCSNHRGGNADFMRGYFVICFVSGIIALLSVLLLHALSSIWLDPSKNLKLNKEFVYVTIAMATASASMSLCAMWTYVIQIYLVCSDYQMDVSRQIEFLKQVSTIRFVATFSAFASVPVFMISFGCYMYMEFTRMAAIIGIAILGATVLFILFAGATLLGAWNRMQNSTHQKPGTCYHSKHAKYGGEIDNVRVNQRALHEYFESKKATNNAGLGKPRATHTENSHLVNLNSLQESVVSQTTVRSDTSSTRAGVGNEARTTKEKPTAKPRLQPAISEKAKDSDSASTLV